MLVSISFCLVFSFPLALSPPHPTLRETRQCPLSSGSTFPMAWLRVMRDRSPCTKCDLCVIVCAVAGCNESVGVIQVIWSSSVLLCVVAMWRFIVTPTSWSSRQSSAIIYYSTLNNWHGSPCLTSNNNILIFIVLRPYVNIPTKSYWAAIWLSRPFNFLINSFKTTCGTVRSPLIPKIIVLLFLMKCFVDVAENTYEIPGSTHGEVLNCVVPHGSL